jgi:hypothetical protein
MGGGFSLPQVLQPPRVFPEDPYPTSNIVNGVQREVGEGCASCKLTIAPNISVSSVKISRPNRTITKAQCDLAGAGQGGANSWISGNSTFDAFKANVLGGRFFEDNKDGTCTQLLSTPEAEAGLNKGVVWGTSPAFTNNRYNIWVNDVSPKLKKGNRFTVSEDPPEPVAFSSDTKVTITPIIPLAFTFNGIDVVVKRMSLYHPCPVRVNNVQYDAVLSLNDPMDADTTTVLLIPIKGDTFGGAKSRFFSNLVPSIASLLTPNPNTKKYEAMDVGTGSTWNLTTLLPTLGTPEGNICTESFFVWNGGVSNYERYFSPSEQRFKWKPIGTSISYIMMENPVPMNAMDLQTLRRMPITPPDQAIHPVPAKFLYQPKTCPKPKKKEPEPEPGQTGAAVKETFENDRCDPFAGFADLADEKKITTETIFKVVLGILSAIAVFLGVYFAIKFAASQKGDILKKIGDKIGKAIGGSGIKAMQKMTEGAVKATAEAATKLPETPESRLSKSLTTEKPTTKPVQVKQAIDKKQLRDLSQFKAQ